MVPTRGSENVTFWYPNLARMEEIRYGFHAWVPKYNVLVPKRRPVVAKFFRT